MDRQGNVHTTVSLKDIITNLREDQFQDPFLLLYHLLVSTDHSSLRTLGPLSEQKVLLDDLETSFRYRDRERLGFGESKILSDGRLCGFDHLHAGSFGHHFFLHRSVDMQLFFFFLLDISNRIKSLFPFLLTDLLLTIGRTASLARTNAEMFIKFSDLLQGLIVINLLKLV